MESKEMQAEPGSFVVPLSDALASIRQDDQTAEEWVKDRISERVYAPMKTVFEALSTELGRMNLGLTVSSHDRICKLLKPKGNAIFQAADNLLSLHALKSFLNNPSVSPTGFFAVKPIPWNPTADKKSSSSLPSVDGSFDEISERTRTSRRASSPFQTVSSKRSARATRGSRAGSGKDKLGLKKVSSPVKNTLKDCLDPKNVHSLEIFKLREKHSTLQKLYRKLQQELEQTGEARLKMTPKEEDFKLQTAMADVENLQKQLDDERTEMQKVQKNLDEEKIEVENLRKKLDNERAERLGFELALKRERERAIELEKVVISQQAEQATVKSDRGPVGLESPRCGEGIDVKSSRKLTEQAEEDGMEVKWYKFWDDTTGMEYYYNRETKETQWERPTARYCRSVEFKELEEVQAKRLLMEYHNSVTGPTRSGPAKLMSRSVSQVLIKCIPEEDDDKNASRDVISPPPNSPENNLPPGTCPPSRPKVDKEKGVGAGGRPTYPPPPSEKPKWYNYLLDFVGSWGKDFLSEERARFGVLGFAFGATSAAVLLKLALLILNNDKKKVDVVVIG